MNAGGNGVADAVLQDGVKPTKNVTLVPVQMHFHVGSEHMIEGGFVRFSECPLVYPIISG